MCGPAVQSLEASKASLFHDETVEALIRAGSGAEGPVTSGYGSVTSGHFDGRSGSSEEKDGEGGKKKHLERHESAEACEKGQEQHRRGGQAMVVLLGVGKVFIGEGGKDKGAARLSPRLVFATSDRHLIALELVIFSACATRTPQSKG